MIDKTRQLIAAFFRYRWMVAIIAVCLIDLSTYLAFGPVSTPNVVDHQDKILHAFGFFVLFVTGYMALAFDLFPRSKTLSVPLFIVNWGLWTGYAVFLEFGQKLLSYRTFSYADLIANLCGMLMGTFFLIILKPRPGFDTT